VDRQTRTGFGGWPRWATILLLAACGAALGSSLWRDEARSGLLVERGTHPDQTPWRGVGVTAEWVGHEPLRPGSKGRILRLSATAPRSVAVLSVGPADWRSYSSLVLVLANFTETPLEVVVGAVRRQPASARLRKLLIDPGGWQRHVLPLNAWFDGEGDHACDFARVDDLSLAWENERGVLHVSEVSYIPGNRGNESCELSPEEWQQLAFPEGDGRAYHGVHFVIITNTASAEAPRPQLLLEEFEEGAEVLAGALAVEGPLGSHVPFILCRTRAQLSAFFARLGLHYGIWIRPPVHVGYCFMGVAAATVEGTEKPSTYLHEAMHVVIRRRMGIAANGNWLQEALAVAVELRSNTSADVRSALRGVFLSPPSVQNGAGAWRAILRTRVAPMRSYLLLGSMVEFLMEAYPDRLPALWQSMRMLPGPIHEHGVEALVKHTGMTLAELDSKWRKWGLARYAD
jgi:hypothetical protein